MRLASLYSGGKDSTFALYWAIRNEHDVKCLITLIPERSDSYMFQVPSVEFTKFHSEALGIPLITAATSGVKEEELEDLKKMVSVAKEKYAIEGVVAGALASSYQKDRVARICQELKLECFSPYWHHNPEKYLEEVILSGFKVIITAVAAEGLGEELLGKELTLQLMQKLKAVNKNTGFHLAFEGGEAETIVLDGPIFKKRIEIIEAEKIMETRNSGYLKIKKVRLVSK
jgi:ABC transporter with metal-binding/Fe-S-binding domain ATP-binding protein